jgi:hypothetical protein
LPYIYICIYIYIHIYKKIGYGSLKSMISGKELFPSYKITQAEVDNIIAGIYHTVHMYIHIYVDHYLYLIFVYILLF